MGKEQFQLMDVTLRDGSYAINFQFSENDTKEIYRQLSNAGIQYIEIGHGVGINAKSSGYENALCTDEEYLIAAQCVNDEAKYGMFCIPGVARVENILTLKKYGASFVRIGTNIDTVDKSKVFIETAKKQDLEVMANYMKSYTATSEQFKNNVKKSKMYGADVVYIVDSSGGMSQEQIKMYFEIIKEVGGLKIGFHGHDNMGMALANSLYAIELGFDFVDTSLKGMGRSAGNAQTELLCACLAKWHSEQRFNYRKIIDCSEEMIRPIYNTKNHNALDIYCGIADFHSSYMKYIHKYSAKFQVNPLDLIIEYSKIDRINMNEEILEIVARSLEKQKDYKKDYVFKDYFGNEQR